MAAKALVLAGFILLFLQGISELIKRLAVIMDLIPEPYQHKKVRTEPGRGASCFLPYVPVSLSNAGWFP